MERYFIRDCNDEIVGNPKGYKTMKGATREAWGRHYATIRARFDKKYPADSRKTGVNPQGTFKLFSIAPFNY